MGHSLPLARVTLAAVLIMALVLFYPCFTNGLLASPPEINDAPVFSITAFRVEGGTLIERQRLEAVAQAYAGPERRFADIEAARAAVHGLYIARGYGAVQVVVPEQEITGGEIVLRVIEARLADIEVVGQRHFTEANIRRSLPALREGVSPNTVDLARQLHLANRNPAKTAVVTIGSGSWAGDVQARVNVRDVKPWNLYLGLDNTGSRQSGEARVAATYRHNNVFDRDHQLLAQYVTSPEHPGNVQIFGLTHRIPLYARGDSLQLALSYSNVTAGQVLDFDLSGQGTGYGVQYTRYFLSREHYQDSLSLGLDYRHLRSDLRLQDSDAGLRTDLSLLPVQLSYEGSWTKAPVQAAALVSVVHNIGAGPDGSAADFTANRQGAVREYSLLRFAGEWQYTRASEWAWRLRAGGQWNADPLTSAEYFGLGGSQTIRGFHTREVTGDRGVRLNVELMTPNLAPHFGLTHSTLKGLYFFDTGRVSRERRLAEEWTARTLSGTGVGVRFNYRQSLFLDLDLAHVLDDGDLEDSDAYRLHGSLTWGF